MGFRDWPAWLKWGIVFEVIYLPLLVLSSFSPAILILLFPWSLLVGDNLTNLDLFEGYSVFFFMAINIILVFAIGAVIGWVIGKVRARNAVPVEQMKPIVKNK